MELPQIKMKKKSNVKNPTSIIPSLKTLKMTLSNHRANPQKSLKWRSLQKKKGNKKLQRSPSSVPSSFKDILQVCPEKGAKKGYQKKFQRSSSSVPSKKKGCQKQV
jgi:hypothetical protein